MTLLHLPSDVLDLVCRDECLCYLDVARLACSCLVLSTRIKTRNEAYRALQRQRTTDRIERVVAAYAATANHSDMRMGSTTGMPAVNWKIKGAANIVFARTYVGGAYVRLVVHDAIKMRDTVDAITSCSPYPACYGGVHDGSYFWTHERLFFADGRAYFVRLIRAMATDYARSLPLATLEAALDRVRRLAKVSVAKRR